MVLNSLNFSLPEKLFISQSILNEIFPFQYFNISCSSLLACRVSAEKSTLKCMGFPLYVTCCFYLAVFNMFSFCLVFVILISMCFGGFPGGLDGKASARNMGDLGSILGLGRPPAEGNGNPLQYSCLENTMD